LADDIVVIDKGKAIAQGTPNQLKDRAGKASVDLTVTYAEDLLPRAAELLRSCTPEVHVDLASRRVVAQADGLADMTRIAAILADSGIAVDDLGLKRPSLDDVFLHLTGHRADADDKHSDVAELVSEGAR
jgi:ABC-2 type transport system ATP-binding protein